METMKAIRIHQYGGPEVLVYEDAPRPMLNADDVLIRVHAAAINPVDWKVREGYLKEMIEYPMPLILGWDVSGVVEAVGENVTDVQVGQEVYSRPDIARNGAYAEYIAVRASEVAPKPVTVDHIHAAAVPLAALTAWNCLFEAAHLSTGQTVLIHAAAGGVGTFAVQLAKANGAYVIGTASANNLEFLRELGADEVVDYQQQRFEDIVTAVDVVFDTIGGEIQERSWNVLKPGGTLVSIVSPPSQETAKAKGVYGAYVFVQPNREQLMQITDLIDGGQVKPIVEVVMPLPEARQAQELSQQGHTRGKIVLSLTA